jgi:hypothetical protein
LRRFERWISIEGQVLDGPPVVILAACHLFC